jgi:hypothetical protein
VPTRSFLDAHVFFFFFLAGESQQKKKTLGLRVDQKALRLIVFSCGAVVLFRSDVMMLVVGDPPPPTP